MSHDVEHHVEMAALKRRIERVEVLVFGGIRRGPEPEQVLALLVEATRSLGAGQLEPTTLAELVACRSYDWLVLDSIALRGVERRRIRAFFRECKRVDVIEVEVGPNNVLLHYGTSKSHGNVRFWLQPIPGKVMPLVIEWSGDYQSPSVALTRAAETVPDFAQASPPEPTEASEEPEQGEDLTEDPVDHVLDEHVTNVPVPEALITPPPERAPNPTLRRRFLKRVPAFIRHVLEMASEDIG